MLKTLSAALVLALASFVGAQVDPVRTVVVINGEEVKGLEYYRRMEYLEDVGRPMGKSFVQFPPGLLALDRIITEKLVMQLAKQKGVLPTDPEVDAELRAREVENPNLVATWTASGRTLPELRDQLRYFLAQFKIQTFGVTVTNQEIDQHYQSNISSFTTPKRAKLRVIVVEGEANRTAVDSGLAAKTPFADLAKKFSVDVTKGSGGAYGEAPIPFLAPAVREAVEKIKIGQVTGWISAKRAGSDVEMKFLLEDILPEVKRPLDDSLRRSIRRQVMLDRGTVKNDIGKEMMAMRQKAQIDIKQPEFADAYRKFIEAYLKQGG